MCDQTAAFWRKLKKISGEPFVAAACFLVGITGWIIAFKNADGFDWMPVSGPAPSEDVLDQQAAAAKWFGGGYCFGTLLLALSLIFLGIWLGTRNRKQAG